MIMKKKVEQSKYKEGFKREVWMAAEKNNYRGWGEIERECRNQPIEFYVVWLCVWSICGSVQHSSTDHYRPHKAQRHQVTRERAGVCVCVSFFQQCTHVCIIPPLSSAGFTWAVIVLHPSVSVLQQMWGTSHSEGGHHTRLRKPKKETSL